MSHLNLHWRIYSQLRSKGDKRLAVAFLSLGHGPMRPFPSDVGSSLPSVLFCYLLSLLQIDTDDGQCFLFWDTLATAVDSEALPARKPTA